jgi:hypothetical protein
VRTPTLTHAPTGTHAFTRTSRPLLAQTATLKLRRLCALPSCATDGVCQHTVSRCSDPRCPATALAGCEHCALLEACTGAAERRSQAKLWKESSAHNPAEWWSFPASATLLEGITLPPELSGYTLDGLDLHVRTACRHARAPAPLAPASPAGPASHALAQKPFSSLKPRWQVCSGHETHMKAPGGQKNAARPRDEPELKAALNGNSAIKVEARKALARRLDRLRLLSTLRASPSCAPGSTGRSGPDEALGTFMRVPVVAPCTSVIR